MCTKQNGIKTVVHVVTFYYVFNIIKGIGTSKSVFTLDLHSPTSIRLYRSSDWRISMLFPWSPTTQSFSALSREVRPCRPPLGFQVNQVGFFYCGLWDYAADAQLWVCIVFCFSFASAYVTFVPSAFVDLWIEQISVFIKSICDK